MENYSSMLEAHYTTETKVKRPNIGPAVPPEELPRQIPFSDKEANKRMAAIDKDIYEGRSKEKAKSEFNKKLYFKIFGGILLTIAGIAGIRKIRNFFRKS